MKTILKQFAEKPLFDACALMLSHLHISFNEVTRTPVPFENLYPGALTKALQELMPKVNETYFIGTVDESSLSGHARQQEAGDVTQRASEGKYAGMMIFAVDMAGGQTLTRTEMATLTRGFNRIAFAQPVVLFIRQGERLALSTCERSEYTQQWRDGEKLGKVSLLRNINCINPHRGHIDILESIGDKAYPTFEELYKHWMQVFSSELLTKKFYNELFEWYQWAVSPEMKVTFPGDVDTQEDDREDIDTKIIRLITRLMFVWFIKQKDLVPSKIFDRDYLSTILRDFDAQSEAEGNYYQAILQNLFFGTLNRPIIEDGERREFAKAENKTDVKNLYRYAELFTISEDEVIDLFSTVPFLNCGLFECQDKTRTLDGVKRRFYYDGFSRNGNKRNGVFLYRAFVPNVLFFHPDKGILSIFSRYVFTIEENTPQDVQVALDPELLGKVFENLLGAYNPETKETARNESGSFYTPREIVQYMVNESLVAHLKQTVGAELESQYRQLLDYTTDEVALTEEQKKRILHSLFTCKVLDPACGSGAFPMGMLQQMVHILQQVDPDNTQWREVLLNMAVDESRRAFGIVDEEERKRKLLEIEETFNNGLNSPDYTRKLYIIESCIYGVDIQPIAMLISRLRFFITLICEQTDIQRDKPELNFGIKTLPNLESKFVAANSLINADIHQYNEDWTKDEVLAILKNELIAIRRRHFYTRKRSEKIRLLKEDEAKRKQIHQHINRLVGEPNEGKIRSLQQQITDYENLLLRYQGEDWVEEAVQKDLFSEPEIIRVDRNKRERERINAVIAACHRDIEHENHKTTPKGFEAAVLQVTDWNPYDQNSVSPFLDIEWMFGVTDGFDIVIGNPPYIQLQNNGGELADLYKPCNYMTFTRMGDIYSLFYERGWQLIKQNAFLCYITSNKWMRAGYGEKTRKFFIENTNPQLLIDFAGIQIFESATVDTNIMLFSKEKNQGATRCIAVNKDNRDKVFSNLTQFILHNYGCNNFNNSDSWNIISGENAELKLKIEKKGVQLKDWDIRINYGLKTGFNNAFWITDEEKDAIIESCIDKEERNRTISIIKPLLRGRDIQKYAITSTGKWLIWIPWHFPCHLDSNIEGASSDAEAQFQEKYPSVYRHLLKFKTKLSNRNKAETGKRYEWYALQRWGAKYWEDFDLPKIVYPNMTKYMPFCYDEKGYYGNDKSFMIAGKHISYLAAFLNSSLFKFCFRDKFPELLGGTRELRKIFFDKIPVLEVDDATDAEFRTLVLDIQKEYSDEKAKAIDQRIFDLYGLTQEERDAIGYIDFHSNNDNEPDEDE